MAENTFNGDYNPANLPFSAEAEQAVLGAIIIDNAMFDNVLDYVKTADYFYISLHKIIFEAMQEMMNFGRAIYTFPSSSTSTPGSKGNSSPFFRPQSVPSG